MNNSPWKPNETHRESEEMVYLETTRKLLCELQSIKNLTQCKFSSRVLNWSYQDVQSFTSGTSVIMTAVCSGNLQVEIV